MLLRLCLFISLILMVGCQPNVSDTNPADGGNADQAVSQVIQWEKDPSYIVFRADVSPDPNPRSAFLLAGEVPFCTIYGDGTVVWSQETAAGGMSVLFGPVDDDRIRRFVDWLVVYKEIYTHGAELELQMSSIPPVTETLFLNVNGIPHMTDGFGGWQGDYFLEIVTACRELSPFPQIYEPEGAWLNVQLAPFDNNAPSVLWEPSVTGIDLKAIADSGEPQWVTGRGLRLLWIYLGRSTRDLQFGQLDGNFIVALQIPNITRTFPNQTTATP